MEKHKRDSYDRKADELINAEIERAQQLHGMSLEHANRDKQLRILVEEVGEVADAIQGIDNAQNEPGVGPRREAAYHYREEVVQVAACAKRMVAVALAAADGETW